MHEMALAESVLNIIEENALSQHFQRVRTVILEIGKLSAVEANAMRFCFEAVTRNTLADGADLQIIETEGAAICLNCNATVVMEERYGLCPQCNSPHLRITAGNQMRVKDLVVDP
jgi:hydrogenase nickel incorporation protein HypA/HybF